MNKQKCSITAAMLTYNRIETAIASIQSVMGDPYVNMLWVFDDGSDLENWAILSKFCENQKKIRLLRNETNSGHDYNFMKSAVQLTKCSTDFAMLCESDMLFAKGWGEAIVNAFTVSPATVCLAPMLHKDQLRPNRSEIFRKRCIDGVYERQKDGRMVEVKKPFGTCYSELPDAQEPIQMRNLTLRYVSNSVSTMVFRKDFF